MNRDLDQMRLAERLVREYRVAVMLGAAFGMGGGCHFRLAFGALHKARVAEGLERLVEGLRVIAR